jgi:hypothetical protein
MMQAAKPWHRYNPGTRTGLAHFATGGRLLRQSQMRSVLVVVADVLIHQAFQVLYLAKTPPAEELNRSLDI